MASQLVFLLGDQLSDSISALTTIHLEKDTVMLCEVKQEATYVKHHPKKIAFIFSAMRHFADRLRAKNIKVLYVALDDPHNSQNIFNEIQRACKIVNPSRLILTEPGEWRVRQIYLELQKTLAIPVEIRSDNRFLSSIDEFKAWAKTKKAFRMEYFYREMRKKYQILIEKNGQPTGGQWNFDQQNRKSPPKQLAFPPRIQHPPDTITQQVLHLVEKNFSGNFGDLYPFNYATTRESALEEAGYFMSKILRYFGDYQDAMVKEDPYLYHSVLSAYLNVGLLQPLELCKMAEAEYHAGHLPLNAVEGFIRQILGWREYVRGIYWLSMPDYAQLNYFSAEEMLPAFYWGAPTQMRCIREAVQHTQKYAYSHHIQRLMVTGNFALLAGIRPDLVCDWYLAVYSDAYEWVELPNTLGMALYADGGIMASKPYAASGKYIHRMSNYCDSCTYKPTITTGDKACPFNALYWNFIDKNQPQLRLNQRLAYVYATWDKMKAEKKLAIRTEANNHIKKMREGQL